QELERVREILLASSLDVEDLQFMIARSDGSIAIIDPARMSDLATEGLKPRTVRERMRQLDRRIPGIGRQLRRIVEASEASGQPQDRSGGAWSGGSGVMLNGKLMKALAPFNIGKPGGGGGSGPTPASSPAPALPAGWPPYAGQRYDPS